MDPINPWVDASEVRRMAERLLAPSRQPGTEIRDAGFDSDFIGYANERAPIPSPPPADPPLPQPPAVIEHHLPPSSATPSPAFQTVQPPPPSRDSARGPFLDRILRFRDWFASEFSATGIFILDREGAVIFDESGNEKLQSLARNLALASRKPGAPPSNVRLKIGTRATLEVIPVDTAYGYLVLAAIVPETLSPAAVAAIMDALSRAAAPPAARDPFT